MASTSPRRSTRPGGKSDRLVSFVDFAPTVLSLAGLEPPEWMQGHAFLGQFAAPPQPFLYGFRGRMDERYDLVRTVTDGRYVYVRNYMPHLIYGQHVDYMFQTPTTRVWKRLHDEGKLTPAQDAFWKTKPPEELYDLQNDPDEVRNLAGSPAHRAILEAAQGAAGPRPLRSATSASCRKASCSAAAGRHALRHGPRCAKYPFDRVFATAGAGLDAPARRAPGTEDGARRRRRRVRYWAALGS